MHLIYVDESGNTGNNLGDLSQPIFVLCAMVVPEDKWQGLEHALTAVVEQYFPDQTRPTDFEVHAADIRTANRHFKGMSCAERIAFRDAWMNVAVQCGIKLIYRSIKKKDYQKWLVSTFGGGVTINPHVAAFVLVARVVDDYLKSLPGSPLGIFVSDDNKEIVPDVEKSIRVLRGAGGALKLGQVVEKGFFIDSGKSLPLQLCDLFALSLRKTEERKCGMAAKSFDDSGIALAEGLVHRGKEALKDVLGWLMQQQSQRNKEATRG